MHESRRKLPCPCGKKRLFTVLRKEFPYGYYIKCQRCGMKTAVYASEIGAIRAWNEMVRRDNDAQTDNP